MFFKLEKINKITNMRRPGPHFRILIEGRKEERKEGRENDMKERRQRGEDLKRLNEERKKGHEC